ncbi:MAG: chorismate mutase [Verrucomicrobia bacterium]|nr:chorismate mutase [Verrucomicrobiota bacterium]
MNSAGLELREIRHAIDGVDEAIATLLASRLQLSRLAILSKAQRGVPVLDSVREIEIQRNYDRHAPGASAVAATILRWCKANHDR